jgi:hypothetical protein
METMEYINSAKKYTLDLSLWLDDYDDIYSDFDSRNYLKRRVSSDFIDELRIALRTKNEDINDLVLLLPAERREPETEEKIVQSLTAYFTRQLSIYKKRLSTHLKKGILLFIIAISLMIIDAFVNFQLHNNLLSSIIRVILEPSGWFLVWISFDILYYDLKKLKKENKIFRELSELKIFFQSSELYNP